jgi:hypothetical protein
MAFTFNSLEDLALACRQRKSMEIFPFLCISYGPTTTICYRDTDGNKIETRVGNFDTADEANACMIPKDFADNSVGTDFDHEDLIRRLQAKDEKAIKKRIEIGWRGMPEHL